MNSNTSCFLSSFGLSLATSPFILAILTLYFITEFMTEFGQASEEIFRSDRLPNLNFSQLSNK